MSVLRWSWWWLGSVPRSSEGFAADAARVIYDPSVSLQRSVHNAERGEAEHGESVENGVKLVQ